MTHRPRPAALDEEVCAVQGHSSPVEVSTGYWECKDCGGEWFDDEDEEE